MTYGAISLAWELVTLQGMDSPRLIPLAMGFLTCLLTQPVQADGEPKVGHLVIAGAAMAVPTYFAGVAIHEGSHALVAKLSGAEILKFKVLPSREPTTGAFYFGYVSYRGKLSRGQKISFFTAPKFVDLTLLGTYAALVFTNTIPENRYGRMAMAVFATGAWVDFSKDLFTTSPNSDLIKTYNLLYLNTEWKRLPLRALQAGLSAAAAYVLFRGFDGVFERNDRERARLLPLFSGTF